MSSVSSLGISSRNFAAPVLRDQRELAEEARRLWQAGHLPDASGFLASHRDIEWDKSVVVRLAYEEYFLRNERGEQVDLDKFCRQFGRASHSVRKHIEVQEILEDNLNLLFPSLPPAWPESGENLLGLQLRDELGRGAFARVYLASEAALGERLVAVKVAQQGADEADTLGRLTHPHIVPVFWVRQDEIAGFTAICMPYLGRATLFDVIESAATSEQRPHNGRFILDVIRDCNRYYATPAGNETPDTVLERVTYVEAVLHLGAQLADGLAAAHGRGILHLDVKPSNVLLTSGGRPMLLDFNLSRRAHVRAGIVGGTLPYMSPEQLRTIPQDSPRELQSYVDARSDVFSLGVVLYELLSGRLPFDIPFTEPTGEDVAAHLLERQQHGLRSLTTLNEFIDAPLAAVIERCLADDPDHRYGSATELAAALRRQLSRRSRTMRWVRTHRRTSTTLGIVTACLCAAGGGVWASLDPYPVRQYQKGVAAYEAGQYADAVGHFDRSLASAPDELSALVARGRTLLKSGEYNLALRDFQMANGLVFDGRLFALTAYCEGQLGHYDEAINFSKKALTAGFHPAEVHNNLGYCYLQRGRDLDEKDAWDSLSAAIVENDQLQPAYYNRALLDLIRGKRPGASPPTTGFADIERALTLGPANAEAHFVAASLHALSVAKDQKPPNEMFEHLKTAVDLGLSPDLVHESFVSMRRFNDSRLGVLRIGRQPVSPGSLSHQVNFLDPLNGLPCRLTMQPSHTGLSQVGGAVKSAVK